MFELDGLDHVALTVRDVERAAAWYVEVLGFERRFPGMWDGVPTFVGLGLTAIALFPAKNNESSPRRGAMIEHVALRASRQNFAVAQARLQSLGVAFEFQDHEISHSIYFQDPDGNQLEITTYEV
ncbi:MAG: VOC family protein [Chthoniobacterales bacterium]|nr:VOC family protein [Chthoniobacterales bacterium]